MVFNRLPAKDPRTVAREIPGIFDTIFPQLVPGVVAHFNRKSISLDEMHFVPDELVQESQLKRSMLFEIAYARGEQLIAGIEVPDWEKCLNKAIERQRRHFDASIPDFISDNDKQVAELVAKNLSLILKSLKKLNNGSPLIVAPKILGFQWIASGHGDFSLGEKIIEVKCTNKHFSTSDYRQLIMYWLLSYASSIEEKGLEWKEGVLLNPRLNYVLSFSFDEMIAIIGAGKSKIDILEQFSTIAEEHTLKMLSY